MSYVSHTLGFDTWESQYLALIEDILRNGDDRMDRTGTGTRALFAKTIDIDLSRGFPAMTTKKLAWKSVVAEMIWFLEGTSDERRLAEILHGTRDPEKTTIWTANAEADYWKPKAKFEGDLGRVYGVQWRHWKRYREERVPDGRTGPGGMEYYEDSIIESEVDQLQELIKKLKTNPTDRRMIVSAWNIAELDQMALPPCHLLAQFFVAKDTLSCQMYQRSVDTMLGLPFNIASYALLTHMLAHVTGYRPGRLVLNLGDVHIYKDHLAAAELQFDRSPLAPPALALNPDVTDIEKFTMDDVALVGYQSHAAIPMKMST